MPQLIKGDTFADGQQVTGARLNQLLDSAQLLVGSITEQTALAAGTVEAADQLNINDNSASALRKTTVGDVLGSNIPLVTSSITAGNGNDIVVTANDATAVPASTYTSADGLTVVVTTPSAHGLSIGQVVLISAAGSGYNGTFRLTAASGSSFTYVMTTAATAGSGSLTYTKKGTEKVVGNLAVTGNTYLDGQVNVGGNLNLAGSSTITGNVTSTGNQTFNGVANFTGTLQVNGVVGYVLTEIYEETIPHYGSIAAGLTNSLHTTSAFTKPVGEIWEMEISLRYYGAAGYVYEFAGRYGSQTPQTGSYLFYERRHDGAGGGAVGNELYTCRWVVTSAETFTSETIKIDTLANSGSGLQLGMQTGLAGSVCSGPVYPSKFRIYKYKTA